MAITDSLILEDSAQVDGRRHVRERHTDSFGVEYFRSYLAEAADNVSAKLAAYATWLDSQLGVWETERNLSRVLELGDGASGLLTFDYSTAGQNAAAAREFYKTATKAQAVAMGAYLATLNNATLANLFNLTNPSAELTALRTKVDHARTLWQDWQAEVGQ